jgi:hypothetical protein
MDDTKSAKLPSHVAYQVRANGESPAFFNRVGSAFAHKDGQGFSIVLDAVPVDGLITLRTPKERLQDMKDGKSSDRARGQEGNER